MSPGKHRVGIAELRVEQAPALLVAYGLGSCLGITLYDPVTRLGAMAHALLPAPAPGRTVERPGKFAATAVAEMVRLLEGRGADRGRLEGKLVGGANMFEPFQSGDREGVGTRNLLAARRTLGDLGIPLVAEEVGGRIGRTVEFSLESGRLLVRTLRGDPGEFEL